LKIPEYARYDYCYKKACEFLEEFRIKSFPINIIDIIHHQRWGLTSYSELMKRFNRNRDAVKKCLGSPDGFTVWDGHNYSISYNDDESLGNRIRFTLMHEVGHIYLGHLTDFESTTLYQNSLTIQENRVLENEANAFARNVLVPVPMYFGIKDKSVSNISSYFGITETAARTRIDFFDRDLNIIKYLDLAKKISLVYRRFMKKQKCIICNAQFFEKHLYCPICGSQNTLRWGDGNMIYPKIDVNKDGKLMECLCCRNEETSINGNYCQICGSYLINECTNANCQNGPLPTNARYCPLCGSQTTLFNSGMLKSWNYDESFEEPEINYFGDSKQGEELPFI